jgi:hypothetical protein
MFLGFVLVWTGVAGAGFAQYAPLTRNGLPPRSGFSVYPTPVKSTIAKSRMLRKKGKPTTAAAKKNGFIPLYPNGKPTPIPVRNQAIPTLPKSGPTSVLAPRNMPYSSLYQDPH